jgi:biopolymer transport protein TolR
MAPANHRIGTLLSEINVIPLVDVVLVLLIIFMITAPMLQMGVDVELPKARSKVIPSEEERIFVTITKEKKIFINRYPVSLSHLRVRLKEILDRRVRREVFFKADRSLPYGDIMAVMAELREAGVDRLGLVTEPQEVIKP